MEIDCGNSAAKWRLVSENGIMDRGVIDYEDGFAQCFHALDLSAEQLLGCRVVSVASKDVEAELLDGWSRLSSLPIRFAKVERHCESVQCGYEDLSQMGVDRWAAVVAASRIIEGACVVIDAGTAITADVLDAQKCHRGGYILPGVESMLSSLRDKTAIPVERFPDADQLAVAEPGISTSSAIANALTLAVAGFVDSIMVEFNSEASVVLTGGHADLLRRFVRGEIQVCPDLVLDGLALLLPMEWQEA